MVEYQLISLGYFNFSYFNREKMFWNWLVQDGENVT